MGDLEDAGPIKFVSIRERMAAYTQATSANTDHSRTDDGASDSHATRSKPVAKSGAKPVAKQKPSSGSWRPKVQANSSSTIRRPAIGGVGSGKEGREKERQFLEEVHKAMFAASAKHRGVDPSEDEGDDDGEDYDDDEEDYSTDNDDDEEEEEEEEGNSGVEDTEAEGEYCENSEYASDDGWEGEETDRSVDGEQEEGDEEEGDYDEDEEEYEGEEETEAEETEVEDDYSDEEDGDEEDMEHFDEDEQSDVDPEHGHGQDAMHDSNYPHRPRSMTTVEEEEEEEEEGDRAGGMHRASYRDDRSMSSTTDGRDSGFSSHSGRATPTSSPGSYYSTGHDDDDADQDACSSDEPSSKHILSSRDPKSLEKELRRVKKQQAKLHDVLLGTEDRIGVVQAEKDVLAAQLRMAKRQLEMNRSSRVGNDSQMERTYQKMARQLQDMQSSTAMAMSDKESLQAILQTVRDQQTKDAGKIKHLTSQLHTAQAEVSNMEASQAAPTSRSSHASTDEVQKLRDEIEELEEMGKHELRECREAVSKLTVMATDFERRCDGLLVASEEKAKILQKALQEEKRLHGDVEKLRRSLEEAQETAKQKDSEHKEEITAMGRALDTSDRNISALQKSHSELIEEVERDYTEQANMKEIEMRKVETEAEYLRSTVREQEQRLIVLNELELRVAELQVGEEVLHNQINEEMEDNKRLTKQKEDLAAALEQEQGKRKALEEKLNGKRVRKEKTLSSKKLESDGAGDPLPAEDEVSVKKSRTKEVSSGSAVAGAGSPSHSPAQSTAVPVRPRKSRSGSSSSAGHRHSIASSSPTESGENDGTLRKLARSSELSRSSSSLGPSSSSSSSAGSQSRSSSSSTSSKKQMLLDWCKTRTKPYKNVEVRDFSRSWSNGLAFCALIHSYQPKKITIDGLQPANRRQNLELAFATAERLGVAPLLDVDDMVEMDKPDWMSVMTYVAGLYNRFAAGQS